MSTSFRKGQITVTVDGQHTTSADSATIYQLLSASTKETVIAAILNSHLVSLDTHLSDGARVRLVHKSDPLGRSVLRRGAQIAFRTLAERHFPDLCFEVGQSLLGGYFYRVGSEFMTEQSLAELAHTLDRAMRRLIEENQKFHRELVALETLRKRVEDPLGYREKLLRTWPAPRAWLVTLDGKSDVLHGVVPPSTSYLEGVEILSFQGGLVLRFGDCCDELHPGDGKALLLSYQQTRDWNEMIGVNTVGDLNEVILQGRFEEVVRLSEALHEKKISNIADEICSKGDIRLVLIAGPSSSGKSTFLRRLCVQLTVNGKRPLEVSLDDYYCDRSGIDSLDLEAPEALDLSLLREQIERLLDGQKVRVPRFNFKLGRPAPRESWRQIAMEPDGIIVLEGLHALNPSVTAAISTSSQYRLFVSALTQLRIDEYNRIPTSKVRLLRRITRDRKSRGASTAEVLQQWSRVRQGERRFIFPYQEQIDSLFDSSLVYEAAVLKSFAWRYLLEVPEEHATRGEAYRLLKFLELFVPVLPEVVPSNSILQEFLVR